VKKKETRWFMSMLKLFFFQVSSLQQQFVLVLSFYRVTEVRLSTYTPNRAFSKYVVDFVVSPSSYAPTESTDILDKQINCLPWDQ